MPTVLPGLLVLCGGLVLAALGGGFQPTVWYPAALFILALLVVTLVAAPPAPGERSRGVELAIAAYALFCLWSYLSILWAGSQGDAWNGANRAFLYGLALVLVTLRPWSLRTATGAIGIVGFGTAVMAGVVLLIGVTSGNPVGLFLEGRLAEPTGYLNATANLWLIGFWPVLYLAQARTLPWPVRGLALAAATVLVEMAVLSQSRGAVIAFAVTGVAYLLLTPRRWPALFALAVALGLVALSFDVLTGVRESSVAADLGPALDKAGLAIYLSAAAAFALGAAAAVLGQRAEPHVRRRPWIARSGDLGLGVLIAAAVIAIAMAIGNPRDWIDARWSDFKSSGYSRVDRGRTRFGGSLGSQRYDYYRVALGEFKRHPVLGIGADNFAAEYLRRRRSPEAPRHPHSLVFRLLSQVGIVGTALFATFLALMLRAAWPGMRRASVEERGIIAAALAAFLMWFVHATGDWLWAFPGLGVPAFAMLAVAARFRPAAALETEERPTEAGALDAWRGHLSRVRGSVAGRAALACLVLAAALSLAIPGVAARYTNAAYDDFRKDPDAALHRLDRAADLNPLSSEPLVAKGVLAQRLGRPSLAIEAFRRAISRQPNNWFAHLELGLALAQEGRSAEALHHLRSALRLNPRQPLVRTTLERVERGRPVHARLVERSLYGALRERLRATDPKAAGSP